MRDEEDGNNDHTAAASTNEGVEAHRREDKATWTATGRRTLHMFYLE